MGFVHRRSCLCGSGVAESAAVLPRRARPRLLRRAVARGQLGAPKWRAPACLGRRAGRRGLMDDRTTPPVRTGELVRRAIAERDGAALTALLDPMIVERCAARAAGARPRRPRAGARTGVARIGGGADRGGADRGRRRPRRASRSGSGGGDHRRARTPTCRPTSSASSTTKTPRRSSRRWSPRTPPTCAVSWNTTTTPPAA